MRLGVRLLPMALSLVIASALIGCGESSEDKATEALGGSEGDSAALLDFFKTTETFPNLQVDLVAAFNQGDVATARATLDEQNGILREARSAALDVEGSELRETLQEYLESLQEAVDAEDAAVVYFESPGPADAAAEAELTSELTRTQAAAREADREFINQLLDALPDDADEEIKDYVEDYERRIAEAGGT